MFDNGYRSSVVVNNGCHHSLNPTRSINHLHHSAPLNRAHSPTTRADRHCSCTRNCATIGCHRAQFNNTWAINIWLCSYYNNLGC
jgi:hypothetical protein